MTASERAANIGNPTTFMTTVATGQVLLCGYELDNLGQLPPAAVAIKARLDATYGGDRDRSVMLALTMALANTTDGFALVATDYLRAAAHILRDKRNTEQRKG